MRNPYSLAQKYLDNPRSGSQSKRMIQADEPDDDDPILTPEIWLPVFKEHHKQTVKENKDFDYLWVKKNRPGLYEAIRTKEKELDALGDTRLSEVIAIMREWRELILKGEFEWKDASGRQRTRTGTKEPPYSPKAGSRKVEW